MAFYLSLGLFVTDDILAQLYYSLVYRFLTYGLVVWGNTYATTPKPIVTAKLHPLNELHTPAFCFHS